MLLLTSPGVQIFDAAGGGGELAQLANDWVAGWTRARPGRLTPQDPEAAAQELERSVRTLDFKGCIVNSNTRDAYLSDRRFWPILEVAQALDVPFYIHPREPRSDMLTPYRAHKLQGAIWAYAAETGLHSLSMIMAGSGTVSNFTILRAIRARYAT